MRRQVYFENLDALRFFAAFFVVLSHLVSHLPLPKGKLSEVITGLLSFNSAGGLSAVSFFFVLSGFLITYLMYLEHEERGRFSIGAFYLRRCLRNWPIYFFSLLFGFVLHPFLARMLLNQEFLESASFGLYALFVANFDHVFHGLPKSGMLGVQWSVAIEEQFYLVWPLLFACFPTKKYFRLGFLVLIGWSLFFRADNFSQRAVFRFHTFCALADLGIGAWSAHLLFFQRDELARILRSLKPSFMALIYVGGMTFVFFTNELNRIDGVRYFTRFISAMFYAFVILEQIASPHSLLKVGRVPYATELGRISYGIYLLHMVPIAILSMIPDMWIILKWMIAMVGTVGLSWISYRFYEKPFLRLKERFRLLSN